MNGNISKGALIGEGTEKSGDEVPWGGGEAVGNVPRYGQAKPPLHLSTGVLKSFKVTYSTATSDLYMANLSGCISVINAICQQKLGLLITSCTEKGFLPLASLNP